VWVVGGGVVVMVVVVVAVAVVVVVVVVVVVAVCSVERGKKGAAASRRAPGPGLVNTATESLVFLSTGGNNGPPRNKRRKTGYLFRSIVPAAQRAVELARARG